MTSESAQIVYVFGPSSTGKVVHGYHHVDGEIPYKHMTLVPGYREIAEIWVVQRDFTPYGSEIARLTLEAAKDHDKVVLSHATFHNCERDVVVQKLVEGGVSEDRITLLQLTIDPKVKFRENGGASRNVT